MRLMTWRALSYPSVPSGRSMYGSPGGGGGGGGGAAGLGGVGAATLPDGVWGRGAEHSLHFSAQLEPLLSLKNTKTTHVSIQKVRRTSSWEWTSVSPLCGAHWQGGAG